jgi:post-segregation antitoxin (ccd killing protein)
MATLEQLGERATTELRDRVDRLVSAVEEDRPDLAEVATLADAVGELADEIARIYIDLDQRLTGRLQKDGGSGDARQERGHGRRAQRQQSQQRQQPTKAEQDRTSEDEATKEELLERARDLDVEGRSSMSKEELAEAVETEEGVTKEELLERAREAGIEGRSSMTKDELRKALHDAGAR